MDDLSWAAVRAVRASRRRRREQIGVEAQPRDETNIAANRADQIERREAGVGDDDDTALGRPSANLENGLASPVGQLLVSTPVGGGVAFGRGEDGEKRQSPASPGPWHGNHGHHGEPAQAAGLDEVTMRGAHGIAVDAARRDLVAPAALDGVVDADHDPSGGREPVEDHQQQFAADGGAVPSRPAEHVVVAREIADLAEADDVAERR